MSTIENWLNCLKTFMNTPEEVHAFINGLGISFCPFLLFVREIRKQLAKTIKGELHYFIFGAILGVIGAVWFWIGIWKFVT